ncbi:MAG: hypothetical protein ACRC6T_15045 [Sarcina sp.]
MKCKKKKGSTLLVVVCLCAFLSILTLSIMVVTTGGFKLRKDENARIENFYSADSGIEIAENEMVKVIEEAIDVANKIIENIIEKPEDFPIYDTSQTDWEQIPFKQAFEEYIEINMEKRIDNTKLGNVDFEDTTESTPAVETKIYDDFDRSGMIIKVDALKGEIYQEDKEIIDEDGIVKEVNDYKKSRYQKWEIKSNFKDKNEKDRTVIVNYKVKTPEYGKESGEAIPNMNIFDYIMAIDGNLDIKSDSSFNALGDMWIGGTSKEEGRGDLFGLYSPAVTLSKSPGTQGDAFEWQGDIVTGKDMLIDGTNLNVHNIYADDLIHRGEGSTVIIKEDLLLSNDLIFDAENTKLTMNNLYALDEVDETENLSVEDTIKPKDNWGKSSSIIVSSKDFGSSSNINVTKDAYVLGTAYLQLEKGKEYKTGESIAINKFSEPYTNRKFLEEGYKGDEYLYKYLNPLHVLDKKIVKGEEIGLTVTDKVQIVNDYFKEKAPTETVFNGLNIGRNSYSSGILYDLGEVKQPSVNYDKCECDKKKVGHKNMVECKIDEFVEEAYNMGGELSISESKDAFNNKKLDKNLSVANSFNWKFIRDNLMTEATLKDKAGNVMFDRVESYPDKINPEVAIFRSRGTVAETIPTLGNNYFAGRKINIIFNISSKLGNESIPLEAGREIHFEKRDSLKVEGNKVILPLNYINSSGSTKARTEEKPDDLIEFGNDLTLIISDGSINIIQGHETPWEVRGMFYTTESLNLVSGSGITFGNYGVPKFIDMNNVFKALFGDVIGGVIDGVIDQGNGQNITNPPDLLEQEEWNLIK